MRLTVLIVFAALAQAQSIRVVRFSESKPFQMGEVTSRRIIHPDLGARKTTLNYSVSKPGAEFAQHVHDYSDDTILVLQGEVDLRQGDSRRRFKAGECAFVPTGQIHGTVTAGSGEAVMISFQNPPDLILYTGARDSKRPGAAPPKGVITPGAVKFLNFGDKNGFFTSASMGSKRAAGARRPLKPGESFKAHVDAGGERLLFVWRGGVRVKDKSGDYSAGEKDTVFVQGPADFEVTGGSGQDTVLIEVQAPAVQP
ncbi:MAG TPA: cupin domain-containing protein [Bryobacteraceae bacterium]|jgi:quercetin dioxygenase-like cupin family protein|nr:cupin domain-containing protein [Bryobacteraceae bacterium]